MATLGEKLKRERETRGVSLSEISKVTNIQSKHLSALEENDFDALPGPVFVTGFLRAYSHHLGLDADDLLIEYQLMRSAKSSQSEPSAPTKIGKGKFYVATMAVILVTVGLMVYLGWSGRQAEKPEQPVNALEKTDEIKKLPPPENEGRNVVPLVEESAQKEELPDTPEPKGEAESPAVISDAPPPEPENAPPAIKKETVRKQMKTKYRLVVSAEEEDVWVSIEVDGETTRNLFVRPGRSIALRADKSITLTSGNAKSMKLTLNGKQLDFKTTPNVIREWSIPLPE